MPLVKKTTTVAPAVTARPARPRRVDAALAGILILAALARIACALPRHIAFGDESIYLYLAQSLASGKGFTFYNNFPELHFPPLFPITLALLHLMVRDWEAVTRVAYVLFGTLLIVPVYLLALEMRGLRVARIAALITALLPAFTAGVLFAETMTEPLYLFLLFSGIYNLYRAFSGNRWRSYAGAGAAFALAYLTRPEGVLYFFLAAGLVALYFLFRRPVPLRSAAGRVAVLFASFLLVAFPYLVFVRKHVGEWTLSTKDTTTYTTTRGLVAHGGKVDGAAFLRDTWGLNERGEVHFFAHESKEGMLSLLLGRYRDHVLPDIKANFVEAVKTVWKSLSYFGMHLSLLALFGLAVSLWKRQALPAHLFHVLMLSPLAMFLIFFIQERYLYPLLLPLVFWAACGVEEVLVGLGSSRFLSFPDRIGLRKGLQACALLVLASYLIWESYQVFIKHYRQQPDLRGLVAALQNHTPPGALVVAPYPQFSLHAERRWLPLPVAPLEDVRRYARSHGGAYLVVVGWHIDTRPEEQRQLLDAPANRPGLELVEARRGETSTDFALYRLTE